MPDAAAPREFPSDASESTAIERPILFSGPMVRAILNGTKTQTRRVVKPQPWQGHILSPAWGTSPPPNPVEFGEKYAWIENGPDYPDGKDDERRCPYGVPGDRLWVRETWYCDHCFASDYDRTPLVRNAGADDASEEEWREATYYRADGEFHEQMPLTGEGLSWRPSIYMPRWASRLTLEITDVRVQRLKEISYEDAEAEGMDDTAMRSVGFIPSGDKREAFTWLWDSINAKRGYSWESNPWVWTLTFKPVPQHA